MAREIGKIVNVKTSTGGVHGSDPTFFHGRIVLFDMLCGCEGSPTETDDPIDCKNCLRSIARRDRMKESV